MKVIKRDGSEQEFDEGKIRTAIAGAVQDVADAKSVSLAEIMSDEDIDACARKVVYAVRHAGHIVNIEEIQDFCENALMRMNEFEVAKDYIEYRYNRMLLRQDHETDDKILALVEGRSEVSKQENANKNPILASTQRDYIAGTVSRDITNRRLLPPDIRKAHDEGIIHFHDADYFISPITNCELINLDDMLQNGTMIGQTLIEKPHSFSTACNISLQISTAVASSTYGGSTWSLTPIAKFVEATRQKVRANLDKELNDVGIQLSPDKYQTIVEERVHDDIVRGIQTIQYQTITMSSTNGQAPFMSVFMYLNEADTPELKRDLAMVIEEMLRQRYQGVKNEAGIWVTPAFPKLLYVLEDDNTYEGSPYFYLTQLAAKCTAKRMVPDYISEKMMKKLKLSKGEAEGHGDVYPCMGCLNRNEVVAYRFDGQLFVESIARMWEHMSDIFDTKVQPNRMNDLYVDLSGIEIYDTVNGWTPCRRIIRNANSKFLNVRLSNGRELMVTPDHPFETENRGIVHAVDLTSDDMIRIDKMPVSGCGNKPFSPDEAWLLGVIACDGCYDRHLFITLGLVDEDDVRDHFIDLMGCRHGFICNVVEQHREIEGNYQDVYVNGTDVNSVVDYRNWLTSCFGGIEKIDRQLPHDFLDWNRKARVALLAGMIDADGFVRKPGNYMTNQASIGSTGKALAIQQMLLVQSLGIPADIVHSQFVGRGRADTICYTVNFKMTQEIIDAMCCEKKKVRYDVNHSINTSESEFATVRLIESFANRDYSYDVTTDSEHFTVSGVWSHNCRSFLTPDRSGNGWGNIANAKNYDGKPKYYGRMNQGVVTINLPDVALSSHGNVDEFWEIFDARLELCHRALRLRHERLLGTPSDVAPILWQYGAMARLKKGETIDKLLYGGYSTISLGYAGLYECVKYMTGKSHTDPEAKPFALSVMQHMNDKCAEWKEAENIDYSLYGTPIESTTYKFAKCLQKRFGIIQGVTDHNYITNSYHVNVREEIDAFTKLKFESEFQRLSPGGAISYVEVPNMQDNLEAVIRVMQFIYENIMYAELNTKSDYCMKCGYDGEIKIVEDDGKLVWECPNCGNRDQTQMSVARRTCGYIGTQYFNQGRTQEIKDRVLHL